jgi:hypothetical protein
MVWKTGFVRLWHLPSLAPSTVLASWPNAGHHSEGEPVHAERLPVNATIRPDESFEATRD